MRPTASRAVVFVAPVLGACTLLSGWSDLQRGPEPVVAHGPEAGTPPPVSTPTTSPSADAGPDADVISPGGPAFPGEPTNLPPCSSSRFGSCRCTGNCQSTCTDADCNLTVGAGGSETADCSPAQGCVVWCEPGATCHTDCPTGNCTIHCAAGSSCTTNCSGGTCAIHCAAGANCNNDCEGASCQFDCGPGACLNDCTFGNCTGG